MSPRSRLRRQLVLVGTAALVSAPLAAAQRTLTPSQMLGPFYPVTPPLHQDNDLTRVEGRSARATGQIADLSGRVLDLDGRPLAELRVEIWQCDAAERAPDARVRVLLVVRRHHARAPRALRRDGRPLNGRTITFLFENSRA